MTKELKLSELRRFGDDFIAEYQKDYSENKDYNHAIEFALAKTIIPDEYSEGFYMWCYNTANQIEQYKNLTELQEELDRLIEEGKSLEKEL